MFTRALATRSEENGDYETKVIFTKKAELGNSHSKRVHNEDSKQRRREQS